MDAPGYAYAETDAGLRADAAVRAARLRPRMEAAAAAAAASGEPAAVAEAERLRLDYCSMALTALDAPVFTDLTVAAVDALIVRRRQQHERRERSEAERSGGA